METLTIRAVPPSQIPLDLLLLADPSEQQIDRDYFLKHYDQPIYESGIQHKDRFKLILHLSAA